MTSAATTAASPSTARTCAGVPTASRHVLGLDARIGCDNGEKVGVAFALDCCAREAIARVAATEGIEGEDVRDFIITAVESRFRQVVRLPVKANASIRQYPDG